MKTRECERMTAHLSSSSCDEVTYGKRTHNTKKPKVSRERWVYSNPDKDGNYTVLKVEKF